MASFTVFVCGTFGDLGQERDGVLDAIRRLKLQHDSMEFFGARTDRPIETCLEEVRASDILVVIVGLRHGSIVPELGTSYSEAEYTEGFRLNKPCLIYMRDEDIPILPKHMERDAEKLKLLQKWKETLHSRHTVATFQDGNGLAVQVAADLSRTIHDLEQTAQLREKSRHGGRGELIAEVQTVMSDAIDKGVPEASLLSAIRSSVSSLLVKLRKRELTVFLSYAHLDSDVVEQVAEGLKAAGIRIWHDTLSGRGENWMQDIERELSTAEYLIFFISPHSVASSFVMRDIQVALHRQVSGEGGAAIVPVLLQDAEVPPLLRRYHDVDLRDGNIEKAVQQLVDAILHWSNRQTA
jgi:hypothetical protein